MPLHRNIRVLQWFNFITALRLYSAFAVVYFARITDSYALGMAVFSIIFVSSALLEVPTGVLSDRVGRRWSLIAGTVAMLAASIFYALPTVLTDNSAFTFLAIGAFLEGLCRSLYSGNNTALIHDSLSQTGNEKEFSHVFGRIMSLDQVAFGLTAVVGAALAEWNMALVMWLSVLPQIVCLLLAFQIVEPKVHIGKHDGNIYDHLKSAFAEVWRSPKLRKLTLASSWGYAFGETSWTFQAAFFSQLWPVWAIGLSKGGSGVIAAVGFHYAGRVIRKFGALRTWLIGDVFGRVIMSIIAAAFPTVLTPAIFTFVSLFHGTSTVAREELLQKEYLPKQRATMGSVVSFAGSLLFAVVSFGTGLLADIYSPQVVFLGLQLLIVPSLVWMWRGRNKTT